MFISCNRGMWKWKTFKRKTNLDDSLEIVIRSAIRKLDKWLTESR